jgi:hypothetical protein
MRYPPPCSTDAYDTHTGHRGIHHPGALVHRCIGARKLTAKINRIALDTLLLSEYRGQLLYTSSSKTYIQRIQDIAAVAIFLIPLEKKTRRYSGMCGLFSITALVLRIH